jgi:type IV fimbrial biogenesis protein FimT
MRNAFTLVEMMIAVAVIAILGTVGVPYLLASLPTYRVNGAVRHLMADFRLAKTTAVERGKDVIIAFHMPGGNQYRVWVDGDEDRVLDPGEEILKTEDIPGLYKGIVFGSGDGTAPADGVTFQNDLAIFAPTGGTNGGTVYLRPSQDAATGKRSRDRKITVTAQTGRPKAFVWDGGWL